MSARRRRGSRRSRARSRSRSTRAGRRTGSRAAFWTTVSWLRCAVGLADRRRKFSRAARSRVNACSDAHAGDVLGERRRDGAERLADAAVASAPTSCGRSRCATDERRDHGQRRERELPVEEEQDHRGADERQRVLDERGDAVGDELVERLDVVRDPADQRRRRGCARRSRATAAAGAGRGGCAGRRASARPSSR